MIYLLEGRRSAYVPAHINSAPKESIWVGWCMGRGSPKADFNDIAYSVAYFTHDVARIAAADHFVFFLYVIGRYLVIFDLFTL